MIEWPASTFPPLTNSVPFSTGKLPETASVLAYFRMVTNDGRLLGQSVEIDSLYQPKTPLHVFIALKGPCSRIQHSRSCHSSRNQAVPNLRIAWKGQLIFR